MIKIIHRPKSERFSQLSFEGFKGKGTTKSKAIYRTVIEFIKDLFLYAVKRTRQFLLIPHKVLVTFDRNSRKFKRFLIRKLIWSRGKLGRPIANLIVMGVAFFVFMFGEVFNNSRYVVSQEIDTDYLSNVSDIIPQRYVATTLVPDSRKRNEPFTYVVEGGDTISGIGSKFKISSDALNYVNGLTDNSILKVGQELTIPPVSGLIHEVEDGDTLASIAEKYDVATQAIVDFNYLFDSDNLAIGTELVIPDATVPQTVVIPPVITQYASAPVVDPNTGGGWCMWPTTTRIITQYFAWYHNGLDIAVPWGQAMPPLYSCAGGRVVRAGWDPWGLGLMVEVDHGNGYSTVYGHMSRVDVGFGQQVGKGQMIGYMGNTGRSTGPHVHFTLKYYGVPQNPLNYIN